MKCELFATAGTVVMIDETDHENGIEVVVTERETETGKENEAAGAARRVGIKRLVDASVDPKERIADLNQTKRTQKVGKRRRNEGVEIRWAEAEVGAAAGLSEGMGVVPKEAQLDGLGAKVVQRREDQKRKGR